MDGAKQPINNVRNVVFVYVKLMEMCSIFRYRRIFVLKNQFSKGRLYCNGAYSIFFFLYFCILCIRYLEYKLML